MGKRFYMCVWAELSFFVVFIDTVFVSSWFKKFLPQALALAGARSVFFHEETKGTKGYRLF